MAILVIATYGRTTGATQAAAQDQRQPKPADPLRRADVAKIYGSKCASCHEDNGSGKESRDAMPSIPDFTSLAWQMSKTDLEITHRIQDGHEPLMPAYKTRLGPQQVVALAIYVRAFGFGSTEPGEPKPAASKQKPIAAHMAPVQVYRAYCLACHDADGRGQTLRKAMPNSPDFTEAKWQAARSNADLKKSILNGKGKFMLAMKDKLGSVDADQMVAYVRAFEDGKQVVALETKPIVKTPLAETTLRVRAATGLYRQYCLICHGIDGKGTEMRASMPTISDFTRPAWHEGVSNPQLVVSILDGKSNLMPAFRGRVSEEQARDLAAFIRTFGPATAGLPKSAPTDFDRSFRDLQAQWEELQKQLRELSRPTGKN